MKGDVLFVVRKLTCRERQYIMASIKESKSRIFWQQIFDGFPSYRHYGIDVGDGTVIHFRGDRFLVQSSARIIKTTKSFFLKGGDLEVADDVDYKFSRNEVVRRAHRDLGGNFGGYNFIFNNCEHFAYWCATDKRISKQVLLRK